MPTSPSILRAKQQHTRGRSHKKFASVLANGQKTHILIASAITLSVLLWASSFPAIQVSLTAYTPAEVAFLRYLIASAALALYALFSKMPMPRSRDIPLITLCGFLGFTLYNVALNAGQLTVASGTASFIISSEVAAIALLSKVFFKEDISKGGWAGIILCLAGVALIFLHGSNGLQLSSGAALVFVSMLALSFYSVLQKPLLKKYTAIQFTTYAIWTGTACLFFLAPQSISVAADAPLYPTLAIAYLGLFPGIVAYAAWSYVLSKMPAAKASS